MPMADTHDEGYTAPPLGNGDVDFSGLDGLVPDISSLPLLNVDMPVTQRRNGPRATISSDGGDADAPVDDDTGAPADDDADAVADDDADAVAVPRIIHQPADRPAAQPVDQSEGQSFPSSRAHADQPEKPSATEMPASDDAQERPLDNNRRSLTTRDIQEDEDDTAVPPSRQNGRMRLVDRHKTLLHMAARKIYKQANETVLQFEDVIANQDPVKDDGDFLQRNVAGAQLAPFLSEHSTEIYAKAFITEYDTATEDVRIALDQLLHATALTMYRESEEDGDGQDAKERAKTDAKRP